jgi:MFS family permease
MFKQLQSKISNHVFYGWIIVSVAAISVFFSAPGQTFAISAFIDSYIETFDFSRTMISTLYSTATILSGTLLVFMGHAVDKFGQKNMLIITGSMLAVACFFSSFITSITMVFIAFFLLRYFGQGSLTLIPGSLVPQWFDKKRAFAISLYSVGGIVANLFLPAFNVKMIALIGWQNTWMMWGSLLLILFLPIIYIFTVNKPEDMGLLADNMPALHESAIQDAINEMKRSSYTLKEALKTRAFWSIGLISMIAPMISTGLMFHFYSLMAEKGITKESAALIIGLVALPGLIMPFVMGIIADKLKPKMIVVMTLTSIAASIIFLMFVKSIYLAAIFMIVYGFVINVQGITLSVMWANYFGRQHLGSIRGAATIFMVIGSALGPLPFGISFDLTTSYIPVLIVMTLVTLFAVLLASSVVKPNKKI